MSDEPTNIPAYWRDHGAELQMAQRTIVAQRRAAVSLSRQLEQKHATIQQRDAALQRLQAQFVTASSIVGFRGITDSSASKGRRGAMSELLACVWLMGQDYEVFRSVHPDGFADLVAYKAGGFMLVDVKTRDEHHKAHHRVLSERQIAAGVRLLTVNLKTGECTLHPPRLTGVS